MSKFYYHGVQGNEHTMLKILLDGEIKSMRLQGIKCAKGLNGLDYVCLCNKLSDAVYKSSEGYEKAYDVFIKNGFSFIVSDKIKVIKCNVLRKIAYMTYSKIEDELDLNLDIGLPMTDMIDEYRVKDKIPSEKILGICIPFSKLSKCNIKIISKILNIAYSNGYDVVDSSSDNFIEKYEKSKSRESSNKLVKRLVK